MPIRDVAAQRRSLMNDYGSSHGSNAPASFVVDLLTPDPLSPSDLIVMPTTSVVVDDVTDAESTVANGYAPVTVSNNDATFPAPDAEGILSSAPVSFPTSLAEYPGPAVAWQLTDPATGDVWDWAPFPDSERIDVTDAGTTPAPVLVIFYSAPLDSDF